MLSLIYFDQRKFWHQFWGSNVFLFSSFQIEQGTKLNSMFGLQPFLLPCFCKIITSCIKLQGVWTKKIQGIPKSYHFLLLFWSHQTELCSFQQKKMNNLYWKFFYFKKSKKSNIRQTFFVQFFLKPKYFFFNLAWKYGLIHGCMNNVLNNCGQITWYKNNGTTLIR